MISNIKKYPDRYEFEEDDITKSVTIDAKNRHTEEIEKLIARGEVIETKEDLKEDVFARAMEAVVDPNKVSVLARRAHRFSKEGRDEGILPKPQTKDPKELMEFINTQVIGILLDWEKNGIS